MSMLPKILLAFALLPLTAAHAVDRNDRARIIKPRTVAQSHMQMRCVFDEDDVLRCGFDVKCPDNARCGTRNLMREWRVKSFSCPARGDGFARCKLELRPRS